MKFIQKKLELLYNKISLKYVIIFTIVFGLFTALALPYVASLTTEVIGVAESPDTSFTFNVDHIFSIVDSYGISGRRFYVLMRWTFDVAWPLIYTLFLGTTIAYLARRSNCRFKYKPLFFVLLAVSFDLLENISATIVMLMYPTESVFFGYLLIIFSMFKWLFISLAFVILLLLLLRFFVISYQKKTQA